MAREHLKNNNELTGDKHIFVAKQLSTDATGWEKVVKSRELELCTGDRLMLLKTQRSLGLNSGETGTITEIKNSIITLINDNNETLRFDAKEYPFFNHGYASTIHKSQGVTKNDVFVYCAGKYWDRHLSYVALTRHRETVNLYANKAENKCFDKLVEQLSQRSPKDLLSGFAVSYAKHRKLSGDAVIQAGLTKINMQPYSICNKWNYISIISNHRKNSMLKVYDNHKKHIDMSI